MTELDRALSSTLAVLQTVQPGDLDAPTPCASWDVRALINHFTDTARDWRMLATGANGQPAAAVYARDADGQLQPYGVCVLTVTDRGISQVTSFGNPGLLAVFGFPPEPGMTEPRTPTSR